MLKGSLNFCFFLSVHCGNKNIPWNITVLKKRWEKYTIYTLITASATLTHFYILSLPLWKLLSCVQLFATPWNSPWHSPGQLEWVAVPLSRGSSQPRDWTQVSCSVGGFFNSWATREAHLCLSCEIVWYLGLCLIYLRILRN